MAVLETEMRLLTAILLIWATTVLAEEPTKVAEGTCSTAWEALPCDKYLYKGNVYVLIWKNGEVWRIVKLTEEGEELVYQAPTRYWI